MQDAGVRATFRSGISGEGRALKIHGDAIFPIKLNLLDRNPGVHLRGRRVPPPELFALDEVRSAALLYDLP